jgi:hypothetical protein
VVLRRFVVQDVRFAIGAGEDGRVVSNQRSRCRAWLRDHQIRGRLRSEQSNFDRETYEHTWGPLDVARRVNDLHVPRRPVRALVGLPEQVVGRLLARYLSVVNTRRYNQVARVDDRWRVLLGRLRAEDGKSWLDPVDVDTYHSVLDEVVTGWAFELRGWLRGHSLLKRYDLLTAMVQRGRRGWADDDLWGLEHYLAIVLSGSLRQIAELSFCWSPRASSSHEDWVAELRRLADSIEELNGCRESGEEAELLLDEVFAGLRRAWGCLHVG